MQAILDHITTVVRPALRRYLEAERSLTDTLQLRRAIDAHLMFELGSLGEVSVHMDYVHFSPNRGNRFSITSRAHRKHPTIGLGLRRA